MVHYPWPTKSVVGQQVAAAVHGSSPALYPHPNLAAWTLSALLLSSPSKGRMGVCVRFQQELVTTSTYELHDVPIDKAPLKKQ